jgi:hypothetical protein
MNSTLYQTSPGIPPRETCAFYHALTFPDGEEVSGEWDLRGRFDEYIGHYPIAGKSLLDIGTAGGFLAFSAEQAGADVTALEAADTSEFRRVPAKGADYFENQRKWRDDFNRTNLTLLKNSWWYAWHKFGSKAKLVYTPIGDLYDWDIRFDVVLAGAVVMHISDPVSYIGAMTHVAREAVIVAFDDVIDTDELLIRPITGLQPEHDYLWWSLSRGLYKKLFDNLGFDVRFTTATMPYFSVTVPRVKREATKTTVIATRR